MNSKVEDAEVIELVENSGDEDEDADVNLTMDAVPFQEKVEKWLMDCSGAKAKASLTDAGSVFQEKTVVVKEVIDEIESLHSVDTEQYIKSNRRKTTTKITTTTIKKYYSMVEVAKKVYNNKRNGEPLLKINARKTNDKEKSSCNAKRRSPRRAAKNLPSVPEVTEFEPTRKKRNHHSNMNADNHDIHLDLNQVPLPDQKESHGIGSEIAQNCRTPYNTRPNDEVKNKIRLCSESFQSLKHLKRIPVPVKKKQNQLSTRGSYVKLKPLSQNTIKNSLSAKAIKKSTGNPKLKTASLRSTVNYEPLSSDSEQDDILLTAYKPFSLCP